MKTCRVCKKLKELEYFHIRKASKDGRATICKPCKKEDAKAYNERTGYAKKNYRQRKEYFQQKHIEFFEWYNNLKSNLCTDCNQKFDPVCMHFDHLPEFEKQYNIRKLAQNHSKTKILEEIKKCELVCANCHALRTKNRGYPKIFGKEFCMKQEKAL